MIAAGKVPVGSLVRNVQLAGHISHAQPLNALVGNHLAGCLQASLFQVSGALVCWRHGVLLGSSVGQS